MSLSMAPTSPRLPSPPPPAEIQLGPQSPALGAVDLQAQQMEQTVINAGAKRRIHPGTKAADMAAGPPLIPLSELDSAFALQEHLAALHYLHTSSHTQPITRQTARLLAQAPPNTDRTLWLYELCRFLIAQCNNLIVGFLFDTPPCSAATCPEMRASEWQFLCAVHEAPKNCCAIDYCCHTLDWAASIVTNPRLFPSRFSITAVHADAHDKGAALKNLVNVFRRLHRIFAHAWFQHRGVFWSVEGQTGLYVLFKTVCDMYDLLPAENYKLPPEAEGLEPPSSEPSAATAEGGGGERKPQLLAPVSIIKGQTQRSEPDDDGFGPSSRTNTRRHIRSSPSTGSAVTTVIEADEDDGTDVTNKMQQMHISTPETVDEGAEAADIPVIVEHDIPQQPARRHHGPATTTVTELTEHEDEPERQEATQTAPVQEVKEEESEADTTILAENEPLEEHPPEPAEPTDTAEAAESAEPEVGDETVVSDDTEEKEALSSTSTHDFAADAAKVEEPKTGPAEDAEEAEKDKEQEAPKETEEPAIPNAALDTDEKDEE